MFVTTRKQSKLSAIVTLLAVIYTNTVHKVRQSHRNAVVAILMQMLQILILVAVFYAMFTFLGLRGAKVRGDFLLYIMSGIFLFISHIKALQAVMGAETSTSAMMQHAPMNTFVSVAAGALSALYVQFFSLFTVLFVYHVAVTPIEMASWRGAFGMFLLAWFSGCSIGMVFMALTPWAPALIKTLSNFFVRINMFASGKMFVANALPTFMLQMFDWNPLFHIIDQARGFVFFNYFPKNSNWEYPLYVCLVLFVLGLMIEFYTRQVASASWGARN